MTTAAEPTGRVTRAPRWTTLLRFAAGYDTNVDLLPTDLGRADASGLLQLTLTRRFARRSWRGELRGDGGFLAYRTLSDYNAFPFGGKLSVDGELDRRSQLSTGLEYRRDYLRNMARFVDAGLVADNVLTSTATANVGLTYSLVPRLGVVTDGYYQRVSFGEQTRPGGETLAFGAGLTWKPLETDQLGARYLLRRERSQGYPGSRNDEGRLSWDHRFTATLTAAAFGGLGRAQLLAATRTVITPSAGARLDGRYGRHQLSATYEHSFGQAYGLYRSLFFDSVSIYESYTATPRLNLFVRGALSRAGDPLDAAYRLDGETLSGALTYRTSPRGSTKLSYTYWTRRETARASFGSHAIELAFLYERPSEALVRSGP